MIDPHLVALWISPFLLGAIVLALVWMIFCANRNEGNHYNVIDLFVNQETGRADLEKHIIGLLVVLSVWTVVVKTMGLYPKGESVDTLLSLVLGMFLAKRGVDNWTQSKADSTTVTTATVEKNSAGEIAASMETTQTGDKP